MRLGGSSFFRRASSLFKHDFKFVDAIILIAFLISEAVACYDDIAVLINAVFKMMAKACFDGVAGILSMVDVPAKLAFCCDFVDILPARPRAADELKF